MTGAGRPLRTLRSQVQLLVAGLLVLLLVSAIGTLLVQLQVSATQGTLRSTYRPAQVAVAMLTEAYTDEQTGERGYLLTGDPAALQPYTAGRRNAAHLLRRLGAELTGDRTALQLLAQVSQQAAAWRSQVSEPEIAERRNGPLAERLLRQGTQVGQRLTSALREGLADLAQRINELAAAEVARINSAQAMNNWLTGGAGAAGLALLVVSVLVLRNSLSRPLTTLVGQVQRVAGGDLGHSVDAAGPGELAALGRAVESMRARILAQTARTMEMQHQLDLTGESERIAAGLQDLVIRRLSGTGLALQSAAGRHPGAARALAAAVSEIDSAIRELRTVVFGLASETSERAGGGLRRRVLDVLAETEPRLGFSPRLQLIEAAGTTVSASAADELIVVLGEILSDIAVRGDVTEADIILSVSDGLLRLRVTDDGQRRAAPPAAGNGLASVRERAARLGGTCAIGGGPRGSTIEWQVPLNGAGQRAGTGPLRAGLAAPARPVTGAGPRRGPRAGRQVPRAAGSGGRAPGAPGPPRSAGQDRAPARRPAAGTTWARSCRSRTGAGTRAPARHGAHAARHRTIPARPGAGAARSTPRARRPPRRSA